MPLRHSSVLGAGVPAAPGQWTRSPSATDQLAGRQLSRQQLLVLPGLSATSREAAEVRRVQLTGKPASTVPVGLSREARGGGAGGATLFHVAAWGTGAGHWSRPPEGRLESRAAASPPRVPPAPSTNGLPSPGCLPAKEECWGVLPQHQRGA